MATPGFTACSFFMRRNPPAPARIRIRMTSSNHQNDSQSTFNLRRFGISVIVAIFVILVGALIYMRADKKPLHTVTNPKPTSAASPQ